MVLNAYNFGIFPWYSEYPVVWYFTNPRCVLYPKDLKIHKSMRSYLNQEKYKCTFNTAFPRVIEECKRVKRPGQEGTWLTPELIECFKELHIRGYAHSVEVWDQDELVGGVYGIKIGHIFFGESMFHKKANASKFGFIHLVRKLESEGVCLIDCQQQTNHLMSFGAIMISKNKFWNHLRTNWLVALSDK